MSQNYYQQQQPPYGQPQYGQPQYQPPYGQPQYQQQPNIYGPPPTQHQAPPPNQNGGGSYASLIPKKDERFKTSEYKDVWAAILWLVFLVGFAGISAFSISKIGSTNSTSSNSSTSPSRENEKNSTSSSGELISGANLGSLIALSAFAGFFFSVIYFMLLQRFAGKMIKISLVLTVAMQALMAVAFFALGAVFPGVIAAIFTLIYAYVFYSWRHRIPFAKVMLKAVTAITQKYPAMLYVGVAALLVQFAFVCWWIATMIGISSAVQSESVGSGAGYFLYVYSLFTFYWTSSVISNTVHITVAGVFGTFYFRGVAQPSGEIDVPVPNPTSASLKRAVTTSLGSNCYGSLLIAILQTAKALIDNARQNQGGDNLACTIILCCISCILGLFEDILEYFNKYAFAQVAIYGKDYCSAAKDTWQLAKARGIDALINDSLIGSVMGIGSILIGLLTCGISLIFVRFSTTINPTVITYIVVGIAAFFIGIVEFSVLANVIDSGVVTTFVCLALDPGALAQTKPQLYQKIQQVYPQVVLGF